MSAVTAFLLSNPLTAPLVNVQKVAIDMYEDAGVKGAEEYINTQGPVIPPQVQAQMQQMQQIIQELQQKLQQAESGLQAKMAEIAADKEKSAAELQLAREKAAQDYKLQVQEMLNDWKLELIKLRGEMAIAQERSRSDSQAKQATVSIDMNKAASEFGAQLEQMSLGHSKELASAAEKIVSAASKMAEAAEKAATKKRGKVK
jgi:hypothetical protein